MMGREAAAAEEEVAGLRCSGGKTKQLGTVVWDGVAWSKFSMDEELIEVVVIRTGFRESLAVAHVHCWGLRSILKAWRGLQLSKRSIFAMLLCVRRSQRYLICQGCQLAVYYMEGFKGLALGFNYLSGSYQICSGPYS